MSFLVHPQIPNVSRQPSLTRCVTLDRIPGYTGPNTMGAHLPFGGEDIVVKDDYEVLVWRRPEA